MNNQNGKQEERGRQVKFAVVGCGHIGKRHAEMICRNENAELVALCDIKPMEELEIDTYQVPFFSSIEELLHSDIETDVFNICTPNGLHAPIAIQVLNENHHVVIEKPMALQVSDAEMLINLALQKQKHIFCVMQNRYSPPSEWLKELIQSGKLGKIYLVQINCYWNRDERYYKPENWHGTINLDGGTLFTQFSHFVDLMYWLFGDITNIQARFKDFNHQHLTQFEDTGIITFDFVNGGIGCFNYSTSIWDKNMESSIAIIAENGSIKVGGQYMNQVEYCHIKDYTMPELKPTNPGNDYGTYKGSAQNHHYVIENVINVLKENNNITTNAFEGYKVVDIIRKIYNKKEKN